MRKRMKLIPVTITLLLLSFMLTSCDTTYEQDQTHHYFKPIVIEAKDTPSSSINLIEDAPLKSDVLPLVTPPIEKHGIALMSASHLLIGTLIIGLFNLSLAIGYAWFKLIRKSLIFRRYENNQ